MNVIFLFSLFTYEKMALISFALLSASVLLPAISQCGNNKKGPSSDLKKKKRSETSDDDSEETEKRAPKKKKRAGDKTSAISTTTHRIKNKKIQKKRKTLDEDENGETIEKKTGQQTAHRTMGKSPNNRVYIPPPVHERPRHPGYEMPIDPTEENKTFRQVERFHDAPNFCNY